MNIKQLETPRLIAYMNILENVLVSTGQVLNQCMFFLGEKLYTAEELQPFVDEAQMIQKENRDIFFAVQKELDIRMRKDLGLSFGIRKSQSFIEKFEIFTEKKSQEKVAMHADKKQQAMNIIKGDQENSKANDTASE